jgi:integrase
MSKRRANGLGSEYFDTRRGLWVAALTYQGKIKRFTAKLQKDAIQRRKDWLELRAEGVRPTSDAWLVGDWLTRWLEDNQPEYDAKTGELVRGWQPTTWASREAVVRRHIKPFLGSIRLRDLTAEDLDRWQRSLHRQKRSPNTQRDALRTLSTALEVAEKRRHVARNMARLVERPKVPEPEHVQPSEADLTSLLRAIRGDKLEALVFLGLGSGLRRSEVAALRWEHIEWLAPDSAVIVAQGRVSYLGKGIGRLERSGLKNGQARRRVHVGGLVCEVLRQRWRHQCADFAHADGHWKGPRFEGAEPSGYVFTSPTSGTPIQVRHIDRYFASVRERASLDIERFHGLRRAFATLLDSVGTTERVGMSMIGHKTPAMLRYYQHPMESQQRQAAENLDRVLRELRGDVPEAAPALAVVG